MGKNFTPVKFASLHIFDIFNGANWARHGGKRRLMAPEGQFMAENDSSWGSLTARQGKKFFKSPMVEDLTTYQMACFEIWAKNSGSLSEKKG